MNERSRPRTSSDFPRETSGLSAVEFALILPIMMALVVGGIEFSHAVDCWRKTTLLARTVADITSQGDTSNPMATSTMQDILSASSLVLAPYSSSAASIVVSAIGVYPTSLNTKPYICSSTALNTTARTAKAAATNITVPTAFQISGMRYLLAEVTMPYKPVLGSGVLNAFTGNTSFTFSVGIPWPVRNGSTYNSTYAEIILPGGVQCPVTP